MKNRFATVFVGVFLIGSALAAVGQAAPRKKRVAIMDFDYGTVHSGVAAIFGQDVDVGKGISDLLVKYLVKDGTYSVIERKALDKILAEQNFSNSDRANP
ncbi:MAG TPA: CsgG/HfaB family protein, partial [Terriglobales bacterium]